MKWLWINYEWTWQVPVSSGKDEATHSFATGDAVEVCEGELIHLRGKIISIDGNKITVFPKHEDLKDALEFQVHSFSFQSIWFQYLLFRISFHLFFRITKFCLVKLKLNVFFYEWLQAISLKIIIIINFIHISRFHCYFTFQLIYCFE